MRHLKDEVFVCLDCETTGLDPVQDRIVEIAAARFTFSEILDRFESLINPECEISNESFEIHRISPVMLHDKPKIDDLLGTLLKFIGNHPIIGHGVGFDIQLLVNAASRCSLACNLAARDCIDTLRLARHYGDSANNSLEHLAVHFNIPSEGAHRAMNDVLMNIEVFKFLAQRYKTKDDLFKILSQPIKMKCMPLGKHKGRPFSEIPLQYLLWAAKMEFDQDLSYSIRLELNRRKKGAGFLEANKPFAGL